MQNNFSKSQQIRNTMIILTGPVGAGKSLLSREIARMYGWEYLNTDEFRYLPHMDKLCDLIDKTTNPDELTKLMYQKSLRKHFPNVPNFYDLGYETSVYEYICKKYGLIADAFCSKAYDIKMLKSILGAITNPRTVLELGGMTAAYFPKEYAECKLWFMLDDNISDKTRKIHKSSPQIEELVATLQEYRNVFEIKLPKGYETSLGKAGEYADLNKYFIKYNSHACIAKYSVDTIGLMSKTPEGFQQKQKYKSRDIICESTKENTAVAIYNVSHIMVGVPMLYTTMKNNAEKKHSNIIMPTANQEVWEASYNGGMAKEGK